MSDRPTETADARETIRSSLGDPVLRLLLGKSQLTQIQLETVLADSLSRERGQEKANRRLFRPSKPRISRGAFNRTLIQAQNNIIRSIYTILLLGYLGLFDTTVLQPFIELADSIHTYAQAAQRDSTLDRAMIRSLSERLQENVVALAKRGSFKDVL